MVKDIQDFMWQTTGYNIMKKEYDFELIFRLLDEMEASVL